MPFGDGTGPFGEGRFTGRRGGRAGRGMGFGRGYGRGMGRGFGRRRFGAYGSFSTAPVTRTAEKLTSEQEDVASKIYEVLPKINCGACGYPTCMDCARAIASGDASYNACRVLRPEVHEKIKAILEGR